MLLLRDVLGWSAPETAHLLEASVASVNSSLQRARTALNTRLPAGRPSAPTVSDDRQRVLLERDVRAWKATDLDGFVALLKEDAVLSMPPWRQWYLGREAIKAFYGAAWRMEDGFRLVPIGANLQPAFAMYSRGPKIPEWRAHCIHLLTIQGESVAALTTFVGAKLFVEFGLPAVLSRTGDAAPRPSAP